MWCSACVMVATTLESFTIDSVIKGHHIYKDVWLSFKCCTIADVEKGLSDRHPAAVKSAELYTLQCTCKYRYKLRYLQGTGL